MPRFSPFFAIVLVLLIGCQMAACIASGDCTRLITGYQLTSSDPPSDCDGCGCCHLHLGFQLAPPSDPGILSEFVLAAGEISLPLQPLQAPFLPPRT